jgi:hypothetical protein
MKGKSKRKDYGQKQALAIHFDAGFAKKVTFSGHRQHIDSDKCQM